MAVVKRPKVRGWSVKPLSLKGIMDIPPNPMTCIKLIYIILPSMNTQIHVVPLMVHSNSLRGYYLDNILPIQDVE